MQIALIGAGPRNLILTERLVTYANQSTEPVTITLFDPFPVGGRVWTPDQNPFFIANTIASHATLFSDDTIQTPYPSFSGPNWFEWLNHHATAFIEEQNYTHKAHFLRTIDSLTPNTYPSRALFGVYSAWAFQQILTHAHANITVQHRRVAVTHLAQLGDQFALTLSNDSQAVVDKVILTPGHLSNQLNDEETAFLNSGLTYSPVGHPGEAMLDDLPAKTDVIVRGLGLSFFDYMAALTTGRGGVFNRQSNGTLVYTPSGNEPHLIAGSRRGQLAHARGINQKTAHVSFQPQIFTASRLTATQPTSFQTFFRLIKAEMQLVYYQNLLKTDPSIYTGDHIAFFTTLIQSEDIEQAVSDANFPEKYRYDWHHVFPHTTSSDVAQLQALLSADIVDARLGNATGPYSNSYEIVKDLRASIRQYLAAGIFDGSGYEAFLHEFGPFNNTVAVGPPLERIEELQALINAGIVSITSPGLSVSVQDTHYQATDATGNSWQAEALVEARLPTPNLALVTDPLMAQLRDDALVTPVTMTRTDGSQYHIQATNMNMETLQVQNQHGQLDNFYVWGVPTEGKRWFTTFLPRPNDHDSNMIDAENIAQTIFK